jgi:hypothetical protein
MITKENISVFKELIDSSLAKGGGWYASRKWNRTSRFRADDRKSSRLLCRL